MARSDRGPRRMFNLQTVVGLLVTGGIIWLGLTRIDWSQTMAAFAAVRIGFVLAGGGLIVAVIAIFAVRWRVLLPTSPSVPVRFVFCYLMIGYIMNAIIPLRLGDLQTFGQRSWPIRTASGFAWFASAAPMD